MKGLILLMQASILCMLLTACGQKGPLYLPPAKPNTPPAPYEDIQDADTNAIMHFKFAKMHGLGNDFIVMDAINQTIHFNPEQIRQLSKRNTGIGFDQCLLVEKSNDQQIDFFYRIFNADGQEVGQCGNGARCLALFLAHYQLTDKKIISVATSTTRMQLHINPDNTVTVDMGIPRLQPQDIPLLADSQQTSYSIPIAGKTYSIHAINVGNPHAVMIVPDVQQAPIESLGKLICEHPLFPQQTNVGFLQILTPSHIRLRVYERGCGETQACGSGAVAAAAIGKLYYQLNDTITVSLLGGDLNVTWPDIQKTIFLTGSASFVYEGTCNI